MNLQNFFKRDVWIGIGSFFLMNYFANLASECFWLRSPSGQIDVGLMFSWATTIKGFWLLGSRLGEFVMLLCLIACLVLVARAKYARTIAISLSGLGLVIFQVALVNEWLQISEPRPNVVTGQLWSGMIEVIQIVFVVFIASTLTKAFCDFLDKEITPHEISQAHRRGFTLVELLVVMGIIALLGAILFPVLGSAYRSAHWSGDAAEMHQIDIALALYQQDNAEYPKYVTDVLNYLKTNKVYTSPLDLRQPFPKGLYPVDPFATMAPSYGCSKAHNVDCVNYKQSYAYLPDYLDTDATKSFQGLTLQQVSAVPTCGLISDAWKLDWKYNDDPRDPYQLKGGTVQMICFDGSLRSNHEGLSNNVEAGMLFFDREYEYITDVPTCAGATVR